MKNKNETSHIQDIGTVIFFSYLIIIFELDFYESQYIFLTIKRKGEYAEHKFCAARKRRLSFVVFVVVMDLLVV